MQGNVGTSLGNGGAGGQAGIPSTGDGGSGLSNTGAGRGGTSFSAGMDPSFSLATLPGDGSVVISLVSALTSADVPEFASFALLGVGEAGVAAVSRCKAANH